ncbi:MAG: four helix bundle protein [Mangrovibacterium sp.]|jgi:four helix bundle protein
MDVNSVSYKNSNLWKKSGELIEKTGSFEPVPEEPHHALFVQFRKAVVSIQLDIKEAYSQKDQQFILYHFSKAKSSCLIVEEMLIKIGTMFPMEYYSEYLNSLDEMKAILDNYIHLSQINLVIEKKRQETK